MFSEWTLQIIPTTLQIGSQKIKNLISTISKAQLDFVHHSCSQQTNIYGACMQVLTAFSHFLAEFCRGGELTHFQSWLMGMRSTLFAFPECWVRDLPLFPYERSVSGRCELHHLGATDLNLIDVIPPQCEELKSREGYLGFFHISTSHLMSSFIIENELPLIIRLGIVNAYLHTNCTTWEFGQWQFLSQYSNILDLKWNSD